MSDSGGALYDAVVIHCRHLAPRLRFRYRLFYVLVDVDRIEALARSLRWFSYNDFNLVSFHDRDHGNRMPGGLRRWAEAVLFSAGIVLPGGRIRLLCLPRVIGFAFNPLSLWYCEHADGTLRAVIAEVRNTFGERHSYLLHAGGAPIGARHEIDKDKRFHVSPFLDLDGRYRFHVSPPGTALRLTIRETRGDQSVLDAALSGARRPLSDGHLLAAVAAMPFMTLKVVFAIHWQALRLWCRGALVRPKPNPPTLEVS